MVQHVNFLVKKLQYFKASRLSYIINGKPTRIFLNFIKLVMFSYILGNIGL